MRNHRIPALPRQRLQFLLLSMLLTLVALLLWLPARAAVPNEDAVPAYAEEQTILQQEKDAPQPGWDSAASGKRHFDRHYLIPPGNHSSNQGEQELILQRGGNTWRTLRNGPIASIAGVLLLVVPLLIFGFYQAVGPARLDRPESGRRIQRFSSWDRTIHWATAISFLVLAISGLIILFGKKVLIPIMGHVAFSWLAIISKYLHNFVGPLFVLCTIAMFITYLRRNFFNRYDWLWVRKGGGLLTHEHVPAGYFNAGEKVWFWGGVVLLGLIMSISGLVLNFVNFGQTRYITQWANYFHLAAGALYMAAAMGHIYIGTWGTPGAYDGMRHGTVDEEWARAHHALWYEHVTGQRAGPADPLPPGTPTHPRTSH
ncbi:formate dehydrogenase subunit gamma [Noviherbaspirillum humi]|uniref:Formate dehydrogenase subunit gamma n=1 Tax=Noviherbaspirillum humi TaxID=1688639 RepID=A0A239M6J2_9BURK|nr:formate dehydrogenase subunit gamma [Noviherbaspirillum humi]SNT37772.1 formate dehydrogenase subunit gamma [Noviherbaspirillum humi]